MTDFALQIPALGRPFNLGVLYDARSEKTLPGLTLWDTATLQKNLATGSCKNVRKIILHIVRIGQFCSQQLEC
jgi:hypothetical protein